LEKALKGEGTKGWGFTGRVGTGIWANLPITQGIWDFNSPRKRKGVLTLFKKGGVRNFPSKVGGLNFGFHITRKEGLLVQLALGNLPY